MNEEEWISSKYDIRTGAFSTYEKNKDDLAAKLLEKDIAAKNSKEDDVIMAQNFGLHIEHAKEKIKEGWIDHPKGMLEVLYERDYVDANELHVYLRNVIKDKYNNFIPLTSLDYLISIQQDFLEEKIKL